MGQLRPLLSLFSVFSINYYNITTTNAKMSIQYTATGFELTTFWLRVSSLNHETRAHIRCSPAAFKTLPNVQMYFS